LAPALAAFSLPSVTVGPAYQLVANDAMGSYAAALHTYGYPSLLGGATVDTALANPNEPFPATKLPIQVTLGNAVAQIVAPATTGAGSGMAFSDATSNIFQYVLPGDLVVITEATGVSIVAAQTNGQSFMTAGLQNRLQAGTPGQFANVQVGDSVVVTGASPAVAGTVTVTAKAPNDLLLLSANINDGTADSSAVNYSITGTRGATNAGSYTVKTVTDANDLVFTSPLPQAQEAPLSYSVNRSVGSVVLNPLASPGNGFTATTSGVTLPADLTVTLGLNTFPLVSGAVSANYRALRTDMAANVREYTDLADITAAFGQNQITPQNPLAYGLSIMLQNTVTPVNGLGLDANAVTNETLSYTNASEVLGLTQMYAIALLSQTPTVHQLFHTHVDQFSAPAMGLERVAIFNSQLQTIAILQAEETTVLTLNGSRILVNTQVDGVAAFASPTHLNDPTSGQFTNVQPGDSVVVQAGTNSIPGTYTVVTKTDNNNLVLSGSIISSGSSADFQYYIVRLDGLGADGITLYDRNAAFLDNGVAAGHYVTIEAGTYNGRYPVGSVVSNTELLLGTAIPGVASLVTAVDYQVDRNLQKNEQAALVAGYSSSFADRRMVHVWPDVLQVPSGQNIVNVPGFYAACAIAALTTGLPTQQGFTNLSFSGFLGLLHSTGYFSPTDLDTIAGGGTMIMAQDGPQQALYVRHELTTDTSSIKFQEYMVTKNVDFIAKFLRTTFKPYIGLYNIVQSTLDTLKTTAQAALKFLNGNPLPKIGSVIISGTLTSIAQDSTQIDTVDMVFTLNIPIPLNDLDITINV
jgi:hypothetical protein